MAQGQARAEQLGVYVAPKFVYGATIMDSTKFTGTGSDVWGKSGESRKISGGSDSAFGGSIAFGYNFDKRSGVPVRTEIEYAIFSETENKESLSKSLQTEGIGWHEEETTTGSLKQRFGIQTLFLNAYYGFQTGTAFTPYVGGGLGMAFVNTKAKYSNSYRTAVYDDDGELLFNDSDKRSFFHRIENRHQFRLECRGRSQL